MVVAFVIMLASNLLATFGLTGRDIGSISNSFPTYCTPDGITFAVWGVIYLLQLVLTVAQFCPPPEVEFLFSTRCCITGLVVRWRIAIVFFLNALWLPLFLSLYFILALMVIIVYLAACLSVFSALNTKTLSLVQFPLYGAAMAANASWLVFATAANFFIVAGQFGWQDAFQVNGTPQAALLVVILATFLGSLLGSVGHDLAWSLVVVWALAGIYRMQTVPNPNAFPEDAMNQNLALGAYWGAVITLVASMVGIVIGTYREITKPPPPPEHLVLPQY